MDSCLSRQLWGQGDRLARRTNKLLGRQVCQHERVLKALLGDVGGS
jgi:hypothetical protein